MKAQPSSSAHYTELHCTFYAFYRLFFLDARCCSAWLSANPLFHLQELGRDEILGPAIIRPAKAGMDFPKQEGWLTFPVGQRNVSLDIYLTPDLASPLPTPKRFQVQLYNASGGARVHPRFGLANITLVSNAASQAVWGLLEQLHQPLDHNILNQALQGLISTVSTPLSPEQMAAVLEGLEKVRVCEREDRNHSLQRKLRFQGHFFDSHQSRSSTREIYDL